MATVEDREKAILALRRLGYSKGPPSKKWQNAGYFDVPGYVMQQLAKEGLCETRKLNGHSPQEYRP